ncbi:hypothetical protein M427DRAFT_57514 [Gonapodya prolifera JEL478]|uniref:Chromosome transmission fidelity protein 8 n=1 Tax=Gonapodya prolifera (strain JEL478) TaxID=1344416 RepID=A0A139AD68_GONPJ|nr:hypothetical protein M427DRAFT_57514 [Gonapodya prolifera JEL478]|eukprot:KXS14609.1 hypothetical protein M427DRAFT_57514 [Gonapodya prolifera JEL478]
MVQIILRTTPLHPSASSTPPAPADIVLLDLQGSIETNDPEGVGGRSVGTLKWNEKGNPVLTIGHHLLEGYTVPLAKPFALLRKRPAADPMPSTPVRNRAQLGSSGLSSEASSPVGGAGSPTWGRTRAGGGGGQGNGTGTGQSDSGAAPSASGAGAGSGSKTREVLLEDVPPDFIAPEYEVVTVIRHKYLFKNRPELLTTTTASTAAR